MNDTTLLEYKLKFAALLQRFPKDKRPQYGCIVAKEVVGSDAAKYPIFVLTIGEEWQVDPVVRAEMDRLDELPRTKEEILHRAFSIATDRNATFDQQVKALRLYSDMNGWTIRQTSTKDEGAKAAITEAEKELHSAVMNPIETNA